MLFEKRNINLTNPPDWLVNGFGEPSISGELVTVDKALTVPALYSAVSIICQDIAALPLILYKRLERGKERATKHALYALLHDAPNPEMTSFQFREIAFANIIGWGDFFGQLIWNNRGEIQEIWPLHSGRMEVSRKDGERIYLYTTVQGKRIAFTADQILHIPGFGYDGLRGKGIISLARNTIGQSMALERYGNRVLKNDARPSVVLKHPGRLDDSNVLARLRDSWNQAYGGAENAGKAAIIEEGMSVETIGFPAKDAQYIETRRFLIAEIARFLRIPPHMLGDVTSSTSWGTGIEQQEIGYLTHTLRPWMVRFEQGLNKDLLFSWDKGEYFFEHLVDAMLRTDIQTRMTAYATAIQNGIYTPNEVRERENLLPYDGGDEPWHPLNMTDGTDTTPKDSAPTQNDPPHDPPAKEPKRDITPLIMDALRRISKRDANELTGANKRWAEKDTKWNAWAEQFYKRDYPEFIVATFEPLVASGFIKRTIVREFTAHLLNQRTADIESANYAELDPAALLGMFKEYQDA